MKKFISCVLAFALCLLMTPMVFAAETTNASGGYWNQAVPAVFYRLASSSFYKPINPVHL